LLLLEAQLSITLRRKTSNYSVNTIKKLLGNGELFLWLMISQKDRFVLDYKSSAKKY